MDVLEEGSELTSVNRSPGMDSHSSSGSGFSLLSRPLTLVAREDDDPESLTGPPRRVARVGLAVRAVSR
jgi:hypothetical protein